MSPGSRRTRIIYFWRAWRTAWMSLASRLPSPWQAPTEKPGRDSRTTRCRPVVNFSIFFSLNTPPDIAPLLRCADLFLFPSSEEGFGTVAIEAAAAGLPVVASELPAIREACAPSHRNFMFAAGDDRATALNIQAILADRGTLSAARKTTQIKWAKQFSIEPVAEQVAEIYQTGHPSPAGVEAVNS